MEQTAHQSLAAGIGRRGAVLGLVLGAALARPALAQPQPGLSAEQIASLLASPDRSAADRINDQRRKPEQILAFIAPRPGMTALDLSAGGGYTTELLARAIGPTGRVFGQSRPPAPAAQPATPAATPEGNSNPAAASAPASRPRASPVALADRDSRMRAAGSAAAPITALSRPFEDPLPPELAEAQFDLATLMFNYHDLGHLGVDRARLNQAVFRALRPGGTYVLA